MRAIISITAIILSILFSSFSVAAEHSRKEFGNKMMKKEWCTEEFHTQKEFHKEISTWGICSTQDLRSCKDYRLVSGGNAWSDGYMSPESSTAMFIKTEKSDDETIEDVKKRLLKVAQGATGAVYGDKAENWWIAGDNVSFLIISM